MNFFTREDLLERNDQKWPEILLRDGSIHIRVGRIILIIMISFQAFSSSFVLSWSFDNNNPQKTSP